MTEMEENRKPRLMIVNLQLENFKSYGGVVNVGPFHKSFSAIVGPNGSGKSNVIDAMLFVFGKRAKQMRLNKIGELIHNSESMKKVESASVMVLLQEIIDTSETEYEVVPNSQLEIRRTVFRNNSSKYMINNKNATFTEVQKLLGSKGVDLDNNRFLILQGEVEQISLMKPKAPNPHEGGLVEYLEDIIGTHKYVEMIESTDKQVEEANEERSLKLTRVRAAEKERDSLEAAKNEAEEYLAKEKELAEKKLLMYRFREHEVKEAQKRTEEKLARYKENLEAQTAQREAAEAEVAGDMNNLKIYQAEYDEVAVEVRKCKDDFAAFERRDISYREDLKHLKTKQKKLTTTVAKETKKIEDQLALAKQYEGEKEQRVSDEKDARKQLDIASVKLEKEFERVKASTADLRLQIERLQEELMPFVVSRNEKKKDLDIAIAELNMLDQKMQAPAQELEKVQRELETSKQDLKALTSEKFRSVQENLQKAIERKEELERFLEDAKSSIARISKKQAEARRQYELARESVTSSIQSNRTESGLLKAARDGHLRGVVGRLSELGRIDDRFDIAVGAAAGGSLQNIVVDSPENAQSCVEYLRKHDLGRATFIILNKLEYLRRDMERAFPAHTQRLFDLIEIPDASNRLAFYYALRDTLVADDLDQATKLAYQPTRRNRVVSIAGQLIESSGAMTGGGGRVPRANLGRKVRAETSRDEMVKHEKNLQAITQELAQARASLPKLQSDLSAVTEDIAALEVQKQKMEMETASMKESLKDLESQIPILKKAVVDSKSSQDGQKHKKLTKAVELKERAVEEAAAPCAKIEQHISQLEEKVLAVGGSPLQNAKDKKENASAYLEEVTSSVHKLDLMIQSAQTTVKKTEALKLEHEKELESLIAELTQKKEEFLTIEQEAVAVSQTLMVAEKSLAEKASVLEELQEKNATLLKTVAEAKSAELDWKHKLDDVGKIGEELEGKLIHWRRKIQEMRREIAKLSTESESPQDTGSDGDQREAESHHKDEGDDAAPSAEPMEEEEEDLSTLDYDDIEENVRVLEKQIGQMKPNLAAIGEYKKKESEYSNQISDLDSITSRRDDARKVHDELKQKRHEEFMTGFKIISMKLKQMYQMITLGGDAELELVDSLDPFSEGIVFSVRPPKKSWKNIANLSGGEKTLSSLALVFALHHYKPTPLYFMDEIDAALDFKNVSIVANYVKERTRDAQFIIISLRNNMFELADRLVGIFKTDFMTKSVTIDPQKFIVPGPAVGKSPEQTQTQKQSRSQPEGVAT